MFNCRNTKKVCNFGQKWSMNNKRKFLWIFFENKKAWKISSIVIQIEFSYKICEKKKSQQETYENRFSATWRWIFLFILNWERKMHFVSCIIVTICACPRMSLTSNKKLLKFSVLFKVSTTSARANFFPSHLSLIKPAMSN